MKLAPYDVREGNFQGGAINVVLKSGTNQFHGSAFYSYTSDDLTGTRTKNTRVTLPSFTSKDYGAQLSGPIIKDKLFFMIAGERVRAGTPIPEGPTDNNAGTPIPGITQALVDQVVSIAKSKYNYDAGTVLNNSDDQDDRLVAKLDANLSDTQRASLTYTYTKDSIKIGQNTFTTNPPGLGLSSDGYVSSNRLHTGVFQLNSDWTDKFGTEFRGFYKDYKRGQDPILGRGFAQFDVCAVPTSDRTNTGAPSSAATSCSGSQIVFGPDISRQTNALTSRTYGGSLLARLTAGDHVIKAFADYQDTKIFNSFLQRSAGQYYFDSLADFQAGNAQRLRYQNAIPSLVPEDAAASFTYQAYTFGIQDNWRVFDTLNVSIGVRYDLFGGNSRAALNPNFLARYGFTNNAYIDGRGVFEPRLGFDYKPTDRLNVKGGVGVFSGGTPDVYVANSFSNTGILANSADIRQNNNGSYTATGGTTAAAIIGPAALTNVNGSSIPAAVNAYLLTGTISGISTTNALDPKFRIPSQWRATLSANYNANLGALGDDWHFGADLFYSAVRNQVFFTDLRSRALAGSLTPDGRQRYVPVTTVTTAGVTTPNFADTGQDLFLTNTKKGRSYIGVLRFDKGWDFGLDIGGSFTYQDIKDQAPATSSTASSNYANGAFLDPNGAAYGISNEQIKYQFKYNIDFSHAFFGDYKTTIALFGETRIGHPFSYTFLDPSTSRSTVFGTAGSGSRYLLYVPKTGSDALVSYDSAATQTAFENFVLSSGLSKFQGKIAPRNAFHSKWVTRVDLHLEQELPTFVGKSKISVFADIENFTNFLNRKWGQVTEIPFNYNVAPIRVACLTAPVATGTAPTAAQTSQNATQTCAQYRYSQFTQPVQQLYSNQSLYMIRVGARFTF